MKQYYKDLYNKVEHIEYHQTDVMTLNLGIAALIFINEKNISQGRVTNKHVISKYKKIIKKINKELYITLEPFEYENRAEINYEVLFFKNKKGFRINIYVRYRGEKGKVSIDIDETLLRTIGN